MPDKVLAQLGNRAQHALRAFTPRDQKAVRAAAETFRPNPKLDTAKVITELGKGEALVSFLEGNGTPSMVERALICPPSARLGPVTSAERKAVIAKSPIRGKYDQTVDPESAYEILQGRVQGRAEAPEARAGPRPQRRGACGAASVLRRWLDRCPRRSPWRWLVGRPLAPHVDQRGRRQTGCTFRCVAGGNAGRQGADTGDTRISWQPDRPPLGEDRHDTR